MKLKKHIFSILLTLSAAGLLPGTAFAAEEKDIIILYENDVHCTVDGYAKLAAMKQELSDASCYTGIVSAGDYIQGSSLGAISQGEYIVNLMNLVGYDAVTLGNHEFDYRLPKLFELADKMNTRPICANFQKFGDSDPVFEPYTIVNYGEIDIAYIGITTPGTLTSSSPGQFLNADGSYAYSFHGNDLCETVQESINNAKEDGAEYIVALSHLGTEYVEEAWSAQALVRGTSGLDAVLDGHSHSVIEQMTVTDKGGNEVIISSTGTKFANIGKMTISDGRITTELVPTEDYDKTDEAVNTYLAEIREAYQALGERGIGLSEVTLTTVNEKGERLIRNTETNLGDFCADAFRIVTGADIGFINGGGIRADISAGKLTFNDILSVFPWNNTVCAAEVTGQQILDMLEFGVMNYPEEDGSFQHVSGITFDLNFSIPSAVKTDENGVFLTVDGPRRISNAKVLNRVSGEYEALNPDKTYTLASHNYLLLEQGGGASMFKNAKILINDGMLDVELLEIYITEHLGGVVGESYKTSQNRIRPISSENAQEHTDSSSEFLPAEETSHLNYTVQKGDTLWAISRKYKCTVHDIITWNREQIQNPDRISIGLILQIAPEA